MLSKYQMNWRLLGESRVFMAVHISISMSPEEMIIGPSGSSITNTGAVEKKANQSEIPNRGVFS